MGEAFSAKKILSSAGISFGGSILSAAVAFISAAYISRYLSVGDYGILQLVTTYYLIVQTLENLAHQSVVKIEIIKNPMEVAKYIGATAIINLFCFLAVMFALGIGWYFSRNEIVFYLIVVSLSQMFKVTNGLGYFLDSKLQVGKTQGSLVVGNIVAGGYRILMASLSPSLFAQLFSNPILLLVNSLGLLLSSSRDLVKASFTAVDLSVARGVLKKSFPLFLTALVTIFMFKLDVIILGFYDKNEDISFYTNAVKLTEPWSYIALALINSMFPTLISSKAISLRNHYKQLRILLCALGCMAAGIAIVTTLFAEEIILLTFGQNYLPSVPLLKVSIWSNVFLFIMYAQQVWEVNESLQRFTLSRFCTAMILNLILNLVLVPRYGALGCAYASVATYAFATLFFNLLSRKTRFLNRQIILSAGEVKGLWIVLQKYFRGRS